MDINVPIVLAMDENYVIPIKTTLWSVFKARRNAYKISIYILCSESLPEACREDVKSMERRLPDVSISFREVDSKIFAQAKTWMHLTVATFYRLAIADLIEEDKCLYLDGDIIVQEDVYPLFLMDMRDNYLAGVKDVMVFRPTRQWEEHRKLLGISDISGYANAGVMMLNLKKIREDNLSDAFMRLIDKGYPYMDQDILNKVCYGKILHLPLQYNFPMCFFGERQMMAEMPALEKQCRAAQDDIKIMHYITHRKPWKNLRLPKGDIWWQFAREALGEECYKELYQRAEQENEAYREAWGGILSACREAESVIIFGYTDVGKEVAEELVQNGIDAIVCYCDNAEEKQGQQYSGLRVLAPVDAQDRYPSATWLITNQRVSDEVAKQLADMGVVEDKMLFYKRQF